MSKAHQVLDALSANGWRPPNNPEAETTVLATMLEPEADAPNVKRQLRPEYFYAASRRHIFEAMSAVLSRGDPVDLANVLSELHARGLNLSPVRQELENIYQFGAVASRPDKFCKELRNAWVARELQRRLQAAQARGGDPEKALARIRTELDELAESTNDEGAPQRPAPRTPAERALSLGRQGTRIPLGLETLDKACRGGLLVGRVVIIGGPPGAGKTTLATQEALVLAQRGVHVAILAADEEADGLLVRIGQNLNLAREDLEVGNDGAKKQLAEQLKPLPLMLFDADEDAITIELAAAELAKAAQGKPSALFIDSIQTIADGLSGDFPEGRRARIDEVMRLIKLAAKRHGHLVIALSEMARGFYRNTNDRIDPLAAFKESGAIEYKSSVAMAMVNVKGEEDLVDVIVAKNRLGGKPTFRIRQSFARARFEEVAIESESEPEDDDEREAMRLEKARGRVLRALATVSTLKSKTAVCKRSRGNKKDNMKAFDELLLEELIVKVDGAFRPAQRPETGGRDA